MHRKFRNLVFATCLLAAPVSNAESEPQSAIDPGLARQYFAEARALSDREDGKLWGRALYGPLMFVDPVTRTIVADRADQAGKLKPSAGVFVGALPPEHNIANTAFQFSGWRWTMVVWPLPKDRDARGLLLIHELWHRIQDDIGFPASSPANAHLDTQEGRYWMRLEWAALRQALQLQGAERKQGLADALTFRDHRRSLFTDAAADERGLEMNEGLANYTGTAAAGATVEDRIRLAIHELNAGERKPTFVRSFAYASGPAYGLLLDDVKPGWRAGLKANDDLGAILGEAIGFKPSPELAHAARDRAVVWGGEAIATEEAARELDRRARVAAIRKKLVEGPTLHLRFSNMRIQLDPDGLIPLDDLGTVYPTARIVDSWGVLTVTDGALIDANWSGVRVAAQAETAARPLSGPGWTIDLAAGWSVVPEAGGRGYRVERLP